MIPLSVMSRDISRKVNFLLRINGAGAKRERSMPEPGRSPTDSRGTSFFDTKRSRSSGFWKNTFLGNRKVQRYKKIATIDNRFFFRNTVPRPQTLLIAGMPRNEAASEP